MDNKISNEYNKKRSMYDTLKKIFEETYDLYIESDRYNPIEVIAKKLGMKNTKVGKLIKE